MVSIRDLLLLYPRGNSYYKKVLSYNPIAYWPLWETSGNVAHCLVNPAQNGTYTGVTLGQPGIGDGRTCPLFDGANDYVNIFSPALAAAFGGGEGSMACWLKVFNVWADGAWRWIHTLAADANNLVEAVKQPNLALLDTSYHGSSIADTCSSAVPVPNLWIHYGHTWSVTTDLSQVYIDGVPICNRTTLGAWLGALTVAIIGARTLVPASVFHGYIAHYGLWDEALPPATMASLAVV